MIEDNIQNLENEMFRIFNHGSNPLGAAIACREVIKNAKDQPKYDKIRVLLINSLMMVDEKAIKDYGLQDLYDNRFDILSKIAARNLNNHDVLNRSFVLLLNAAIHKPTTNVMINTMGSFVDKAMNKVRPYINKLSEDNKIRFYMFDFIQFLDKPSQKTTLEVEKGMGFLNTLESEYLKKFLMNDASVPSVSFLLKDTGTFEFYSETFNIKDRFPHMYKAVNDIAQQKELTIKTPDLYKPKKGFFSKLFGGAKSNKEEKYIDNSPRSAEYIESPNGINTRLLGGSKQEK